MVCLQSQIECKDFEAQYLKTFQNAEPYNNSKATICKISETQETQAKVSILLNSLCGNFNKQN